MMDMISMMVLGWLIFAIAVVIAELISWISEIYEDIKHP